MGPILSAKNTEIGTALEMSSNKHETEILFHQTVLATPAQKLLICLERLDATRSPDAVLDCLQDAIKRLHASTVPVEQLLKRNRATVTGILTLRKVLPLVDSDCLPRLAGVESAERACGEPDDIGGVAVVPADKPVGDRRRGESLVFDEAAGDTQCQVRVIGDCPSGLSKRPVPEHLGNPAVFRSDRCR